MDEEHRNMMNYGDGGKMSMNIPERIVLSAGYDGDDNKEDSRSFRDNSLDETPLVNPDQVMAGMHTPPSILTIDHNTNSFNNDSPNWHTEGDGADEDNSLSSLQKYTQMKEDAENSQEDYSSFVSPRSMIIAGQETQPYPGNIPFDDPRAMQKWYTSMQRRLTVLENELEYQNRVSNVWKYFLLTLSIVNPFVINYFLFSRRR